MSYFSGIGSAKIGISSAYFEAGNYVVDIVAVKMVNSRKREDLYTIETCVVESDNPKVIVGRKYTCQYNRKHDSFFGNVKGFLAAANGVEPDPRNEKEIATLFTDESGRDIAEEVAEMSVSDENPLAGTRLTLNCVIKKTRAGNDFTIHNWSPYKGE
jgi:hypothetical protein